MAAVSIVQCDGRCGAVLGEGLQMKFRNLVGNYYFSDQICSII